MKKSLGILTAVFPMPVLMIATYDETGVPNVMNAAWGSICDYDKIALMLAQEHKSTKNILHSKAFTVSIADVSNMEAADYFGIASANRMPDKFACSGYTAVKSELVNAPVIQEFPITMECELVEVIDNENIFCVIGKICNVLAEESLLAENGKIDVGQCKALLFDPFQHGYYTTGEKVGKAWDAGKAMMQRARK